MSSRSREGFWWLLQALSGLLLLFFVTLHIVRVHLYGSFKGLPSYLDVVNALRNPWLAILAVMFTIVVAYHALYGIKNVLEELGLVKYTELLSRVLIFLGAAIIAYIIYIVFFVNVALP